jgi:hypothetical protein
MDTIDIALLVIVIAIVALIPIGCIMTRKSKTPPATQNEPLPYLFDTVQKSALLPMPRDVSL